METFSALLALCEGKPPVTGEFSAQRPVTRSFGDFFDLRLNKRLNQDTGDLRRHRIHCDVTVMINENCLRNISFTFMDISPLKNALTEFAA